MPIEIKELVIRAVVDDDDDREVPGLSKEETARLIQSCVREVLRIMKESKER